MYLIAVSGGPDSMLLLDFYKHKKVVVAHVNYHKREDSNNDEKIVRDFCQLHNIPLEVLNVKSAPKGNFQAWARDVRYKFFKEVYDKYECNKLLMAHHKDDFIETALMQQQSGRIPRFFGIREKNEINGMKIERPLIDWYFKSEIVSILDKKGIKYAIDYTNDQPVYERNKVRLELKDKTRKEKQDLFKWFEMSNKILAKKFKRVDYAFKKWEASEWDCKLFNSFKFDKEEIIFEFIHKNFADIKLSSAKIKGLIQFIEGVEGGKSFILNKENKVTKIKSKLKVDQN